MIPKEYGRTVHGQSQGWRGSGDDLRWLETRQETEPTLHRPLYSLSMMESCERNSLGSPAADIMQLLTSSRLSFVGSLRVLPMFLRRTCKWIKAISARWFPKDSRCSRLIASWSLGWRSSDSTLRNVFHSGAGSAGLQKARIYEVWWVNVGFRGQKKK